MEHDEKEEKQAVRPLTEDEIAEAQADGLEEEKTEEPAPGKRGVIQEGGGDG